MKPRLIVFAKDPVSGRVKTRLGASIGNDSAALLYKALVSDLLAILMHETKQWDIEIHLDRHSKFYEQFGCPTALQEGSSLGEKIFSSMRRTLESGSEVVCVLGSDSPALRAGHVSELLSIETDVAIGPTTDGGYWGIAARRIHPEMFASVRWSSEFTRDDTQRAALAVGLSVGLGPKSWDLDDKSDLDRLVSERCGGVRTADVLHRLLPGERTHEPLSCNE